MKKKWGVIWKKIKEFFLHQKRLFFLISSGLFINLLGWLGLKFFFPFNQETVILHYNAFLGIDDVEFDFSANRYKVFLPLAGGLLIWLINFLVGSFLCFFNKEKKEGDVLPEGGIELQKTRTNQLGAYLLWLAGDVAQVFVLVYVLAIILINL